MVRIELEIWKLVRKYLHICNFRKYTFKYQDPLNFVNASLFSGKIRSFTQSISMRAVLEIFVKFEIFLKVIVNEKVSFTDHALYSF